MLMHHFPFEQFAHLDNLARRDGLPRLDSLFHLADPTARSDEDVQGEHRNQIGRPAVDIFNNDTDVTLRLDVPGLTRDEISIEFTNGRLTVSGERSRADDKAPSRGEIWYGAFQREFTLPKTVDIDNVDASLRHGVLTLVLKKRDEELPRKIVISDDET